VVPDGLLEFGSICIVMHDGVQNVTGKSPYHKRKDLPKILGNSGVNAAVSATIESEEAGFQDRFGIVATVTEVKRCEINWFDW
jgi:hypothetical protein